MSLLVTAQNLAFAAEIRRIDGAMADIPHAFVKGVALATSLYDRLGQRPMSDIDLLVPPAQLIDAVQSLESIGYRRHASYHAVDHAELEREAPLVRDVGGSQMVVDLHWHLVDPVMYTLDERDVWSRLATVDVQSHPIPTTDPTLTVLHLAIHDLQHRCTEPHIQEDLRRAVARWREEIDWESLRRLAERAGAQHVLAFALRTSCSGGLPIKSRRAQALSCLIVTPRTPNPKRKDFAGVLMHLVLLTPRGASKYLFRLALPPRHFIGTVSGIEPAAVTWRHYLQRMKRLFWEGVS